MGESDKESWTESSLRLRAVQTLLGASTEVAVQRGAASALGVLHRLAITPTTAPDALTILHELQVHQVEIDLQEEELRSTRADMERVLRRQMQLYDHAPMAYLTLNTALEISELNLRAARMLGETRAQLIGAHVRTFFEPGSHPAFQALVGAARTDCATASCRLQLGQGPHGTRPTWVLATASADPDAPNVLLTLVPPGD